MKEASMARADVLVGIGLVMIATWVFWYSEAYRKTVIYIYGPNFFPQILAILIGVGGIMLIVRAMRGKALAKTDRIYVQGFVRTAVAIGICVGYLYLMQVIGFAMGTSVFLFVLMTFLGQQGVMKRVITSIGTSLAVWAMFRYFLVIPLPTGMFEFTF